MGLQNHLHNFILGIKTLKFLHASICVITGVIGFMLYSITGYIVGFLIAAFILELNRMKGKFH